MAKADTPSVIAERKEGDATVYDFRCPVETCNPGADPFHSTGWVDRKHAVARAQQHKEFHDNGTPMPELNDFRVAQGVTQEQAGEAVKPADWKF
jgi:hypothetical protein